jgi:glycosyltransferase involved in cell wall biosynthesis
MRVALNGTCFNSRPSGARQRFIGLYNALIKRLCDVEFVIYEPQDCKFSGWFEGAGNTEFLSTPIPSMGRVSKFLCGMNYWRRAYRREKFSIVESMNMPFVKPESSVTILTIHDIRGIYSDHNWISRQIFRAILLESLRSAEKIITVSEAMKDEILNFYPLGNVSVVYNGFDLDKAHTVTIENCRQFLHKHRLSGGYCLAVGHLEKRKNYINLIRAIAVLRARGLDCRLLIVGNDSGELHHINATISKFNLERRVTVLSNLSESELRCAYAMAELFVFPSTYEGFGIPILEAMSANIPMALSDLSVFREITQNRYIYFSPQSVEDMAFSIETCLTSSSLRGEMMTYGRKRIMDFGYESLAEKMSKIYDVYR